MFNVSMRSGGEENLREAEQQMREGEREREKKVVDEDVVERADLEPGIRGAELVRALSIMRADSQTFEVDGLFRGLKKWEGGGLERLLGDDGEVDEGFDILRFKK